MSVKRFHEYILGIPIIQDEFIILIMTNKLEYAIQKLQGVTLPQNIICWEEAEFIELQMYSTKHSVRLDVTGRHTPTTASQHSGLV